eukprot:gene9101-229_t
MFFDDIRLGDTANVTFGIGSAWLVSTYSGPAAYTGWGYPSGWRIPDPGGNKQKLMLIWHLAQMPPKVPRLPDGKACTPTPLPSSLCTSLANVTNCVTGIVNRRWQG